MSALPDMYAKSSRAEGIHIRWQSMSAHVITNMLHFWYSQNLSMAVEATERILVYYILHCTGPTI